jgi:hypothetical protein
MHGLNRASGTCVMCMYEQHRKLCWESSDSTCMLARCKNRFCTSTLQVRLLVSSPRNQILLSLRCRRIDARVNEMENDMQGSRITWPVADPGIFFWGGPSHLPPPFLPSFLPSSLPFPSLYITLIPSLLPYPIPLPSSPAVSLIPTFSLPFSLSSPPL